MIEKETVELTRKKIEWKLPDNDFDFDFDFDNYIPKFKELQEELDDPSGMFDSETISKFKLYQGYVNVGQINQGMIINGAINEINTKEVIIDIGGKDSIIIDRKGSEDKICEQLKLGQFIDVLITEVNESPYIIKGSIAELVKYNVEQKMKVYFVENTSITGLVKVIIPAGYLVDIEIDGIIINAFMPNTLADVNKLYDNNILLNKKINVMLETLQQDKGIYVVSRKKYLKTLIPEKIKELKKLNRNKVYEGRVTGTRNFGIFVQFEECLTGMIHKANIRKDYQNKITEIEPGTLIDFYIKDIIKGGNQIILTQILKESLWDTIRVGDTIDGKVIIVKPFGALIELDYETNGLIQTTYINKNNKKLNVGDKIKVVVISIIRDDRKIYLTFKNDLETIGRLKDKYNELEKLKQKFSKY